MDGDTGIEHCVESVEQCVGLLTNEDARPASSLRQRRSAASRDDDPVPFDFNSVLQRLKEILDRRKWRHTFDIEKGDKEQEFRGRVLLEKGGGLQEELAWSCSCVGKRRAKIAAAQIALAHEELLTIEDARPYSSLRQRRLAASRDGSDAMPFDPGIEQEKGGEGAAGGTGGGGSDPVHFDRPSTPTVAPPTSPPADYVSRLNLRLLEMHRCAVDANKVRYEAKQLGEQSFRCRVVLTFGKPGDGKYAWSGSHGSKKNAKQEGARLALASLPASSV